MNKPVAWVNPLDETHIEFKDYGDWIPLYTHPVKEPIYRFDDEMLTELITTMDSVDAYMEAERRGFNDAKWKDIANGVWQDLMKLIYQVVNRIEENGEVYPVKELTLTDDEIDDVWAACSTGESDTIDMHLFAEAILRKAQEK